LLVFGEKAATFAQRNWLKASNYRRSKELENKKMKGWREKRGRVPRDNLGYTPQELSKAASSS
jgi:hypothetical protein